MIQAGETLGSRYVVSKPPVAPQAGALFEMIDRKSAVVYGQLLSTTPVGPAVLASVRQEIASIPALQTVLKPRDLVASAGGFPVGVLERPGIGLLRDRVAEMTEAQGKREASLWLLRQFATLAADLAQIHQAGATHGAITAGAILCNAQGPVASCTLSGFGVGAVARQMGGAEPSKRGDLVDLLTALHEIFTAAGTAPSGGAAAKWLLLRHSAAHGEHPALASGNALATALNEMASLPEESDVQRPSRAPPRTATMTAPQRFEGRASAAPPGRASTPQVAGRASSPNRPSALRGNTGRLPTAPPPPRKPRVSIAIVATGVTLITAVVVGAVYFGLKTREDVGVANLRSDNRARRAPAQACQGESLRPVENVGVTRRPNEYEVACTPGTPRLVVVAREGTKILANARPAARGEHFARAATEVHGGAVELGSVLALDDSTWITWRNGVGSPLGLARLDGNGASAVEVPLAGWDSVPLRGAHILHVTPRTAWLVTNVSSEGGAHGVLLELALNPSQAGRPPVIAWYLGSGTVDAVVTGEAPTLLVRQRATDANGTRYDLTGVTLRLAAVAGARAPSEAVSVRGANLPDAAIERTPPASVRSDVVVVAPHGVGANGTPSFLITAGQARPAENCADPARCVSAGQVSLVTVAQGAAPTVTPVLLNAWGNDLVATPGGGLKIAVTTANVAGAEVAWHTLLTASNPGERIEVATERAPRARFITCGAETWTVFDPPSSPNTLTAVPTACLQQR